MIELVLDALAVTRNGRALLKPTTAHVGPGGFTAIVGPNGAGKSTLLRAAAGLIAATGTARIDGHSVPAMTAHHRARMLGYLPQRHDFAWPIPVRDMVALGQYAFGVQPHRAAGQQDAVAAAMTACGIAALADQPVDQLSGGECALAALARVLVANTPLLLLDEPVAALDVARQYAVLEHLAGLAARGRTIVAVLHDIALVAQFADYILWMADGAVVATTDASQAAIIMQVRQLFGQLVAWSDTGTRAVPYFQRQLP